MSGTKTRYEVILEDLSAKSPRNRWTMMFSADDFGHAEEQAKDVLDSNKDEHSEIVTIHKELDD